MPLRPLHAVNSVNAIHPECTFHCTIACTSSSSSVVDVICSLAPWQNGVIIDRFDKPIFQKKSKRYKKIQFSTLKGCALLPEKKFATIVNLVTPCLRFTRSSSTFCPIPPNLEMIQAISFRGHCPSTAALANHSSPRPSVDRQKAHVLPLSRSSGGPLVRGPQLPTAVSFAECILLFCCCSQGNNAIGQVICAHIRVRDCKCARVGGREADDDVAPMCSTHAKYTLRAAACAVQAKATDPSESTTRGTSSNEGGSRSTSAE